MGRRPRAVRLGIPALFVAILTFVALWRVGAPLTSNDGGTASSRATPLDPLTKIAEVLTANSVGRQASLDNVVVRDVPSARTLWIGTDDERVFVVLDPVVKNPESVPVQVGSRLNLLGLVRAVPPADVAMRQWALDAATAEAVAERGTYVHVTEISRPTE
jgi:hypothetical protein